MPDLLRTAMGFFGSSKWEVRFEGFSEDEYGVPEALVGSRIESLEPWGTASLSDRDIFMRIEVARQCGNITPEGMCELKYAFEQVRAAKFTMGIPHDEYPEPSEFLLGEP